MITLEYLQELGKFTLDLIKDLKVKKELPHLENRFMDNDVSLYRYKEKNMLGYVTENNPMSDNEFVLLAKIRNEAAVTSLKFIIPYYSNLNNYKDISFEEDFFALITALSDSEMIELYLLRTVRNMLECTKSTDRMVINSALIHEYYQKVHNE